MFQDNETKRLEERIRSLDALIKASKDPKFIQVKTTERNGIKFELDDYRKNMTAKQTQADALLKHRADLIRQLHENTQQLKRLGLPDSQIPKP